MSNGSFSCSYRTAVRASGTVGIGRAKCGDQRDACQHGAERLAIEHVNLAAAAALARMLVECRLEHRRPEEDARQAEARSVASANRSAVDATARRRARTAASCPALPRRSFPRTGPCRDTRSRCRASECSGEGITHGSPRGVVVHVAPPARHRDDVEVGADAEVLVEQARQLADRHAVAHRNRDRGRRTTRSPGPASAPRPRCRRSGSAGRTRSP